MYKRPIEYLRSKYEVWLKHSIFIRIGAYSKPYAQTYVKYSFNLELYNNYRNLDVKE